MMIWGADSLDVFQIIMGLEEEFDIEIPNEQAEKDCYSRGCGRTDQSCNERKLNTDTKGSPVADSFVSERERSDRY